MTLREFIKLCAVHEVKIYFMDGISRKEDTVITINIDADNWKWLSDELLNREIYVISTDEIDTISVELKDFRQV